MGTRDDDPIIRVSKFFDEMRLFEVIEATEVVEAIEVIEVIRPEKLLMRTSVSSRFSNLALL